MKTYNVEYTTEKGDIRGAYTTAKNYEQARAKAIAKFGDNFSCVQATKKPYPSYRVKPFEF